jgi:CheY-like chemotaxis protein
LELFRNSNLLHPAACATCYPLNSSPVPYAPRILIVEDEPAVRALFERILSEDGYDVRAVATGRHALLLLRDITVDVVIVDMSLPDRDGPDVIREMLSEFPYIKAVAASGAMEEPMRAIVRLAGAVNIIRKPTSARALRDAVYSALDPSLSWRSKLG